MSKRILVVDDEPHIVQVLLLKLRNAGYDVMTAQDGEEGLELALQHEPDLIITDFHMPYMSGLDLCHALSRHPTISETPVFLLTARGYALDDHATTMTNRAGEPVIRLVIGKPFSPREIVEQIARMFASDEQELSPPVRTEVA